MNQLATMINSHPKAGDRELAQLSQCIEACMQCAQVCTSCADACLAEPQVQELTRCIRLDLDCADVCSAAARMLTRLNDPDPILLERQLQAVIAATQVCAEECKQHAGMHEHCRVCAETCVKCTKACEAVLEEML
jgi:hypothetical protein